jgi:hypothetical protein
MSSSFAAQLGIEVESLSETPVTLANGSDQPVSRTVQPLPFSVGADYTEDLHFTVTDLTYDVILGLPWLESGNKSVDWRRRTFTFVHDTRLVTLAPGRPSKRALRAQFGDRLLNAVQINKILRKKQPIFQVVPDVTPDVTNTAPEAERCEKLEKDFLTFFPRLSRRSHPPTAECPSKSRRNRAQARLTDLSTGCSLPSWKSCAAPLTIYSPRASFAPVILPGGPPFSLPLRRTGACASALIIGD